MTQNDLSTTLSWVMGGNSICFFLNKTKAATDLVLERDMNGGAIFIFHCVDQNQTSRHLINDHPQALDLVLMSNIMGPMMCMLPAPLSVGKICTTQHPCEQKLLAHRQSHWLRGQHVCQCWDASEAPHQMTTST